MGSIDGPGDESNPGAVQGVQTGEKWCRARHRAGDKAKKWVQIHPVGRVMVVKTS